MRGESSETLKEGGKTPSSGRSTRGARAVLVVSEVALAVTMLSGAGMLLRSLWKLQATDLGFDASRMLTMALSLPPRAYDDAKAIAFVQQLTARVGALPGVRATAVMGWAPIVGGGDMWSILVDGRTVKTIAEAPSAAPQQVTSDYFATMRIPLRRGRAFTDADRANAPMVVVVNETMAKQRWPGQDALGHTIRMFSDKAPWATVVGVARDIRSSGFQSDVPPTMYFPYAQAGQSAYYTPLRITLAVKSASDPLRLVAPVRQAVRELDRNVPISDVRSMEALVGSSIASRRFSTTLLAAFAALALALAGIGIYGVIAYGVSQRTYEIGLRMALGAQQRSVLALVMSEGLRLTLVGLVIGLVSALGVAHLIRTLLVGVSIMDLPTLAAVSLVLLGVAAFACLIPARRAILVSPTEALRGG
jgi:predicted permease